MKTATKKPKAPPLPDTLCVRIGGSWYTATSLSPNPVANPSWSLTKIGAKVLTRHAVSVQFRQCVCDCPDYVIRRARLGEECKHIRACVKVGLLPNFGGQG